MSRLQPKHAAAIKVFGAVVAGILACGCSSHTAELDDRGAPIPPRNVAVAREEVPPVKTVERASSERPPSRPDPRHFTTPDGRPAPYGRDPVTGRPVAVAAAAVASDGNRTSSDAAATIVVAKGESLAAIARRYNVDVEAIKRANGLASEHVHVGQRLTIPDA